MPSAARSKPFRPLQSVPRREKRLACEARSSTRKEREAKRRVSHATQREAHPSAARHMQTLPALRLSLASSPSSAGLMNTLARPCRAHALQLVVVARPPPSHTHITNHTPCCRPLLLLPSPSIPLPSLLPFAPSEMPSPPSLAHTLAAAMRARAHAAITLRCVAGERDSTDHIQHTHITSHTRIQRAKSERRTHIICGRRTGESGNIISTSYNVLR